MIKFDRVWNKLQNMADIPKRHLRPAIYDALIIALVVSTVLLGIYSAGFGFLGGVSLLFGMGASIGVGFMAWSYYRHHKMPWAYYPAHYLEKENIAFNTLAEENKLTQWQARYFLARRWYRPPCQFGLGQTRFAISTELHYAAEHGRGDLIEIFLEHGADRGRKDIFGNTALAIAVQNRKADVIALLAGPQDANNPSVREKYGFSDKSLFAMAIEEKDLLSLQALCAIDQTIKRPMPKSGIPIDEAIDSGNLEILKCLIHHFKLSVTDLVQKNGLLHRLAAGQHKDALQYFLNGLSKEVVNTKNTDNRTARDVTNILGLRSMEALLEQHGGELSLQDKQLSRLRNAHEARVREIQAAMAQEQASTTPPHPHRRGH